MGDTSVLEPPALIGRFHFPIAFKLKYYTEISDKTYKKPRFVVVQYGVYTVGSHDIPD